MKKTTIAQRAGIAPSHVTMILQGKRRPSPEVAERLEQASGWNRLFWLYPGQYDAEGKLIPTATPATAPESVAAQPDTHE